jgi:hypothetical protein
MVCVTEVPSFYRSVTIAAKPFLGRGQESMGPSITRNFTVESNKTVRAVLNIIHKVNTSTKAIQSIKLLHVK